MFPGKKIVWEPFENDLAAADELKESDSTDGLIFDLPQHGNGNQFNTQPMNMPPSPQHQLAEPCSEGRLNNPPVKFETALEFIEKVKIQFQDRPDVYQEFLGIMKSFKLKEIDTPGVVKRITEIFSGHKDLIIGFNLFLPEGYKI